MKALCKCKSDNNNSKRVWQRTIWWEGGLWNSRWNTANKLIEKQRKCSNKQPYLHYSLCNDVQACMLYLGILENMKNIHLWRDTENNPSIYQFGCMLSWAICHGFTCFIQRWINSELVHIHCMCKAGLQCTHALRSICSLTHIFSIHMCVCVWVF